MLCCYHYWVYDANLCIFTNETLLAIAICSFPGLERAAKRARGPLAFRIFLLLDWALTPAQTCLFRMEEEGDVNYAAMLYLAAMSSVLEICFGESGFLRAAVPDIDLLFFLNYLIFFQHMLLLPQWAMAVFRWFSLI